MSATDERPGIEKDEAEAGGLWLSAPDFWPDAEVPKEIDGNDFAREWLDGKVSRRGFLRILESSMALLGAGACTRQAPEGLMSAYDTRDEEPLPDVAYYASSFPKQGFALGTLVTTYKGWPTKIDGNPHHPATRGRASAEMQASILSLYDPDRARGLRQDTRIVSWSQFENFLNVKLSDLRKERLHILTGPVNSPSLLQQMRKVLAGAPAWRWHFYDSYDRSPFHQSMDLLFGGRRTIRYRIEKAQRIVAVDCDFLYHSADSLRYAAEFAAGRQAEKEKMSRLYAIESQMSITGSRADHRLALRPSRIPAFLVTLAVELGALKGEMSVSISWSDKERAWIKSLAADLKAQPTASLLMAGEHLPTEIQAFTYLLNEFLGSVEQTIEIREAIADSESEGARSFESLIDALNQDEVDGLLILGVNPVYEASPDFAVADALRKAKWSAYLSPAENETSRHCHWFLPEAHDLEGWSDGRGPDGTVSFQQALLSPLHQGRSASEVLSLLQQEGYRSSFQIVQDFWKESWGAEAFSRNWENAVRRGLIEGSESVLQTSKSRVTLTSLVSKLQGQDQPGLELIVVPDGAIGYGEQNNNPWLQELPKPFSKITWQNAAFLSPRLARSLSLQNGDLVELSAEGKTLKVPIWIQPGQADQTLVLTLGYGRDSGRYGKNRGYNANLLRRRETASHFSPVQIRNLKERGKLVCAQGHFRITAGQGPASFPYDDYLKNPTGIRDALRNGEKQASLVQNPLPDAHDPSDAAWGMMIDLHSCIGCNACMIACQAENNVPTVGEENVARGREMHWIRVEQYYEGPESDPRVHNQPVLCMHCESAPCETVCPVGATVHSSEGLNEMVYNRCIGTRYCSNNCPYKVRRFNYLDYGKNVANEPQRNPNVTVRTRGVMEKCSYCVQRIAAHNHQKILGKNADRLETACQQTCPVNAISFGNLRDQESDVARLSRSDRAYALLGELNTRPRTRYLSRLWNFFKG